MNKCSNVLPAAYVAKKLDCSVAWLIRCRRAFGKRLSAYVTVSSTGAWAVSEEGFRLFQELQNLRRSMGVTLGQALKLIERFDPETGLYEAHKAEPIEWKKRWETARDEIAYLRSVVEVERERVSRERDLMAHERHCMAWERWRSDSIVWQMTRALTVSLQNKEPVKLLPKVTKQRGGLRALLAERASQRNGQEIFTGQTKEISFWDRIFRPASLRRAA